jgi:hypothetical protein
MIQLKSPRHCLTRRVSGWGINSAGQISVPAGLSDVLAIAACSSNSLALIGTGPPVITAPLANRDMDFGATNWFRIVAVGERPLSYQWKFNGTNLPGATSMVLGFTNLQYAQAGFYSVQVDNRFGTVTSSPARLRINRSPVADASATKPYYVTCNGTNATAIVDGSRSSDPDGDSLLYSWFEHAGTVPLATGIVARIILPIGSHQIKLVVSDGIATRTDMLVVSVQTSSQAAQRLIALVKTNVLRPTPLLTTLNAALDSINSGETIAAFNQLEAFKNKVRAQVMPDSSALADILIQTAQQLVDSLNCGTGKPRHQGRIQCVADGSNGKIHLHFTAEAGVIYAVEASTDLVSWEIIGVVTTQHDGLFDFEDSDPRKHMNRFYRVCEW